MSRKEMATLPRRYASKNSDQLPHHIRAPKLVIGGDMMERKLTMAEIFLIAGTRVALGAGIGLLLSNRLSENQRRAAGIALAVVGGLSTIPLAITVIGRKESAELEAAA
jgi:hypothetical protein